MSGNILYSQIRQPTMLNWLNCSNMSPDYFPYATMLVNISIAPNRSRYVSAVFYDASWLLQYSIPEDRNLFKNPLSSYTALMIDDKLIMKRYPKSEFPLETFLRVHYKGGSVSQLYSALGAMVDQENFHHIYS